MQVYVLKRPHVDIYLQRMGELYECVLFTASLAKVCKIFVQLICSTLHCLRLSIGLCFCVLWLTINCTG